MTSSRRPDRMWNRSFGLLVGRGRFLPRSERGADAELRRRRGAGASCRSPGGPEQSPGWDLHLAVAAIAITVIAGAEHLRGIPGGVAALGLCLAVGFLLAGRVLDARERGYAVVLAVALSGAALLVLLGAFPGEVLRGSASDQAGPVDLRGRRLDSAMVDHLNLRGSLLAGAQLGGLDLRKKSLAGATAPGVGLAKARLDGISARGADLSGADLRGACLRGTDLTGAILAGARVDGADLSGAILDRRETPTWLGRPALHAHGCE
jgi:hypothetical protein